MQYKNMLSRQNGLTLLEITIAMLILALTMAGLTNVFLSSKKLLRHGNARMTAVEAGKYFFDSLQDEVRQDEWSFNCLGNFIGCPSALGAYTFNSSISTFPETALRKVKLTVSWNRELE